MDFDRNAVVACGRHEVKSVLMFARADAEITVVGQDGPFTMSIAEAKNLRTGLSRLIREAEVMARLPAKDTPNERDTDGSAGIC